LVLVMFFMGLLCTGRKEVSVSICDDDDDIIVKAIRKEVDRGGQAFIVVPFVRDVGPTRARVEELMDNITCIEAHGQHEDLEQRIDFFSTRQVG
jgi:transcription-repair coupling factor (superfamily II helicase)